MLSTLWRCLLSVSDLRRPGRLLLGQSRLDVVFITNIRDEAERRRFFPAGASQAKHASGPRMYLDGVAAQVRGINFTAEEMYTPDGRRKAKAVFIDAVRWAEAQGAKVVLLAASTKRLFGRDGAELKARFPNLVFTIGDNGTAHLLCADIERALKNSGLDGRRARILVVGPYGILGSAVSDYLAQKGYIAVGCGSNRRLLVEFAARTNLPITHDLSQAGQFDMVVTCTHSADAKLTPELIEQLRRPHRKLLVVDVAEPANLDEAAYQASQGRVVRQDAGNGHSPGLHYVLGALSHNKLHLPRGTVFGCFAEAMALHHRIFREHDSVALCRDWFEVNPANTALVAEAFAALNVGLPAPHCFGQRVHDFSLHNRERQLSSLADLMPPPAQALRQALGTAQAAPVKRQPTSA